MILIMTLIRRFGLFFLLCVSSALCFASIDEDDQQLIVNNRILARIGDHTISVLDVMKKMEVYLVRSYPNLSRSAPARYQFFSSNWRYVLNQMIDNELILADAEQAQLKIGDAEIRETLHERFGPNIMPTLDSLGISYDEAWRMIYSEIAVQRMSYFRVQSKALQKIGPHSIKTSYKDYILAHPPSQRWKYQLLSIRAGSDTLGSALASKAFFLLDQKKCSLDDVANQLKEEVEANIQVSEVYEVDGKDLSEAHKKVLLALKPGHFSPPIVQVSRSDQSIVHRIFFLKERKEIQPPSFDEMTEKLHDELVQKEIDQELPSYLSRLRKRFNFDEKALESIPPDFQPFQMR